MMSLQGVRPLHRDTQTKDDEASSDDSDADGHYEHGDYDDHLHGADGDSVHSEDDQAGDGSGNLKGSGDGECDKSQGQTMKEAMHNRRQGAAQYKVSAS